MRFNDLYLKYSIIIVLLSMKHQGQFRFLRNTNCRFIGIEMLRFSLCYTNLSYITGKKKHECSLCAKTELKKIDRHGIASIFIVEATLSERPATKRGRQRSSPSQGVGSIVKLLGADKYYLIPLAYCDSQLPIATSLLSLATNSSMW